MRRPIAVAMLMALPTVAVAAPYDGVPMQSLLDKGFKVVAGDPAGIILQKDNQVYWCQPQGTLMLSAHALCHAIH